MKRANLKRPAEATPALLEGVAPLAPAEPAPRAPASPRASERPAGHARRPMQFMIDSGAYSAWRLGKAIDRDAYCNFLLAERDWITSYINLDIIIPEDPEKAARLSFENLEYLRTRGLEPMAVFHAREDISWLDRMLDAGCKYIGLAARSLKSAQAIDEWYSLVWPRLLDSAGNPVVRVHGLGETRPQALLRYPWVSSDSVTWLNGQMYGWFFIGDGRIVGHANVSISSSNRRPDVDILDGEDRAVFDESIAEAGVDPGAFADRKSREAWAVRAFMAARHWKGLEEQVARAPRGGRGQQGLLTANPEAGAGFVVDDFGLYLGSAPTNGTLAIAYAAGAAKSLVSFYYISDKSRKLLRGLATDPEKVLTQPPFDAHFELLRRVAPGTAPSTAA